jgi:hypothetical protein
MAALARALIDADEEVDKAEAALKAAKEAARLLREETIPGAMQELGLDKIRLDTGAEISVKQDVYASIPEAQKAGAFAWLTDNGFGGIIKTEVSASFARGDRDAAIELRDELERSGYNADLSESVHAQTMKAFLREQLKKGVNIPLDLFGARPVFVATVKQK